MIQPYMKIQDKLQMSVRGVFSQEANEEAERIMKSKSHILNTYGQNVRSTNHEGIQTLYEFTRFK